MNDARQFCTFYLNHLLFGVESQKIQEVVTYRELRPVPLAPPVVAGLMNLRGQVVLVLELAPPAGAARTASGYDSDLPGGAGGGRDGMPPGG